MPAIHGSVRMGRKEVAVARAVWTGSVSFGLVSIPVKLYPATVPRQVRFHQFARGTGQRIRHRRVIEGPPEPHPEPEPQMQDDDSIPVRAEGEWLPEAGTEVEVPFEDIVKGYEVSPGQFVMVKPEEIETLRPEPDHIIEIQGFVKL